MTIFMNLYPVSENQKTTCYCKVYESTSREHIVSWMEYGLCHL